MLRQVPTIAGDEGIAGAAPLKAFHCGREGVEAGVNVEVEVARRDTMEVVELMAVARVRWVSSLSCCGSCC